MRTRHKMIAAAGTVGLAGLVGAVVAAPTMTAAADSAVSSAATGRAEVIANVPDAKIIEALRAGGATA